MPSVLPPTAEVLEASRSGRLSYVVGDVLGQLVGQALREIDRAADMVTLGFGDDVVMSDAAWERLAHLHVAPDLAERLREGARTPRARIRLNIQCPFRLDSPAGPFVGGHDIYHDARPAHERLPNMEWDVAGENLFDAQVDKLRDRLDDGSLVVRDVVADAGGGFDLDLGNGWAARVCPASGRRTEHWRLFYRDADPTAEHLVLFPE